MLISHLVQLLDLSDICGGTFSPLVKILASSPVWNNAVDDPLVEPGDKRRIDGDQTT